MFKKNNIQYFVLCFLFIICMTTSALAAASAGSGGGGSSSSGGGGSSSSSGGGGGYSRSNVSSGGGGGYSRSSVSAGGGGGAGSSDYSSSSYSNGSDRGLSDEAFENNGWTVVSRGSNCILLSNGNDDYTIYRYSGGYIDHQYLNWYVENVWDSSEDFDYNKFLNYVNKNQNNLDRAFGSRFYFDGSVEDLESGNFIDADFEDDDNYDYDDYVNNNRKKVSIESTSGGPGVVNNNVYNAGGASNNNVNIYETYGKVLASSGSQWVKNQNGTYSLFYVDNLYNQPTIARNGFFTIVDSANNYNINTYYFDNNGIMVTTPFVAQNGQTINFTSTGEVIR